MKKWSVYLGIVVSGILLWWAFRDVDLVRGFEIVKDIRAGFLIPSTVFFLSSVYFRALRWRYLLLGLKDIPTGRLFPILSVGLMLNNILPARAGEFGRAYLVGRKQNISGSSAFSTVFVERVTDVTILLFLLGGCLVFYRSLAFRSSDVIRVAGLSLLFMNLLLIGGIWGTYKYRRVAINLLDRLLRPISSKIAQRVANMADEFIGNLNLFKSPKDFWLMIACSLCFWASAATSFYFVMSSFSMDLDLADALLVQVVTTLGVVIPSVPGFIGTFHGFCRLGLSFAGIRDPNLAVSYAVVIHLLHWILTNILGFYYLWTDKMSIWTLSERFEETSRQ